MKVPFPEPVGKEKVFRNLVPRFLYHFPVLLDYGSRLFRKEVRIVIYAIRQFLKQPVHRNAVCVFLVPLHHARTVAVRIHLVINLLYAVCHPLQLEEEDDLKRPEHKEHD